MSSVGGDKQRERGREREGGRVGGSDTVVFAGSFCCHVFDSFIITAAAV